MENVHCLPHPLFKIPPLFPALCQDRITEKICFMGQYEPPWYKEFDTTTLIVLFNIKI